MKGKSAAEIIAFVTGQDYAEMKDYRYQSTRTGNVAVYAFGNDYYCCPTVKQKPPEGFCVWTAIAAEYGRTVYRSRSNGNLNGA